MNDDAGIERFVAFTPHDDALAPLLEYRSRLFASGLHGAQALPPCVLLGKTAAPVPSDAMKRIAALLRDSRGEARFEFGAPELVGLDGEPAATFGRPILAMRLQPSADLRDCAAFFDPFRRPYFPLALLEAERIPLDSFPASCGAFRAGYVSNLALRPLGVGVGGLSFEWVRGKPAWLPK